MSILIAFAIFIILVLLFLSFNVIRERRQNKTALGDNHIPSLERAIRAHANFLEYTPLFYLFLLTLYLVSVNNINLLVLFMVLIFSIGRLLHIYALIFHEPRLGRVSPLRPIGMIMTFLSFIILAIVLLLTFVSVI